MTRTLTLTALGLAMALSSATGALASGKKPGVHPTAAAAVTADPRKMSPSGRHQGWCALDPSCNGWQEWLDDVHAGKLKDLGYDAQ
jgi:hypothetical protein